MDKVIRLALGDIKNIRRDIVLLGTIIAPILISLVLRFGVPVIRVVLKEKLGFEFLPYYPLAVGMALLLTPLIIGCMSGFILLEDKDENILMYYSITPLTKKGYLLYRILSPVVVSTVMSFWVVYFSGLIQIEFIRLLPVILMTSMEAPMIALALGSFASNRVEGLALSKIIGVVIIAPILDTLLSFNFKWVLGILPTYWIPKAIAISSSRSYAWIIIVGVIVHGIYMLLLTDRFIKKV